MKVDTEGVGNVNRRNETLIWGIEAGQSPETIKGHNPKHLLLIQNKVFRIQILFGGKISRFFQ